MVIKIRSLKHRRRQKKFLRFWAFVPFAETQYMKTIWGVNGQLFCVSNALTRKTGAMKGKKKKDAQKKKLKNRDKKTKL